MLPFKVLGGGGATVASLLRGKRLSAKPAHKAELQQWENEGGTPAPCPEETDTLVTAGSA